MLPAPQPMAVSKAIVHRPANFTELVFILMSENWLWSRSSVDLLSTVNAARVPRARSAARAPHPVRTPAKTRAASEALSSGYELGAEGRRTALAGVPSAVRGARVLLTNCARPTLLVQ